MCKAPRAVKTRQKLDKWFPEERNGDLLFNRCKVPLWENRNVLSYLVVIVIKKKV